MSNFGAFLAALSIAAVPTVALAKPTSPGAVRNVVLVHGAFADGSGWRAVADILRKDGYTVSIVQQPMTSLEDDVAATKRVLDRQTGPAVLVGHSYGGAIITEAGNNPNVTSLVYVAGFAPDAGEAVGALIGSIPPAAHSIAPTDDGFLFVDPAQFPTDFAADLPLADAQFMAISQMPAAGRALGTPITNPAWKSKPSYGIVATEDRMINPELERTMYKRANARITEITGSHAIFISRPSAVAKVIEEAARAAK